MEAAAWDRPRRSGRDLGRCRMTALMWYNLEGLAVRAGLVLLVATFLAILLMLAILLTATAVGPQQLRDAFVRLLTPDS